MTSPIDVPDAAIEAQPEAVLRAIPGELPGRAGLGLAELVPVGW